MDDALYRLHAEREQTYWWWVGKNRIIMAMVEQFWLRRAALAGAVSGLRPRALDIGCGAGGVLAKLAERFDAVGVDMSPIAREYCAKRGLNVLDGSLPDGLPFTEPESFDVIVMSEVIEHVKEDRASIAAAAKLLRPGGVLVCTVPAHMWLWSSHDDFNCHQRRYTRAEFGALFQGVEPRLERMVLSYMQAASLPLVVAARWMEKMRTRLRGRPPSEPAVRPLTRPVNWALTKAFEVEKVWLRHGVRSPWGTSVIGVFRRPG